MIYISQIRNNRPAAERNSYPYNILSIAKLDELSLRNPVTFIIATHSPILLAYPNADIYQVTEDGLQQVGYEDTEQYRLTKYFMNNYNRMLQELGL